MLETVAAAGAAFRGVHYYEGHLSECCAAAGADEATVSAAVEARTAKCVAAYERLADVIVAINLGPGGKPVPEVITSGTPGFTSALGYDLKGAVDARLREKKAEGARIPPQLDADVARNPWPVHRVSPGTVVFHDWRGERQNPGMGLVPAAALMARVVSLPSPGEVVTLDCGSKSLAAEAGDPAGYIIGRPEWTARACSEEHLPCSIISRGDGGQLPPPKRGDVVFIVPEHICPTVNLAEQMVMFDGDTFVGLVDVEGRGHEIITCGDA